MLPYLSMILGNYQFYHGMVEVLIVDMLIFLLC